MMTDNKSLTPLQKVVLFAFVSLMFGLPQFIRSLMILNTGFGDIRPLRLYLQVLPALYIIHTSFWRRSFKFPHLVAFLLMIAVFMLFENYLSLYRDDYPRDYQLFWRQVRIYIFFLMLVNFGLNRVTFYKVIDFAFYSGILMCLITYTGYLGFFDISFYRDSQAALLEARPQHLININEISYLFTFTVLLLIIKQIHEKRFSPGYLFRDFTVILSLLGMITINASRGAFIISIIFVLYYIYFLWRYGVKDKKIKVLILTFLMLVSTLVLYRTTNILENLKSKESQITLIRRFQIDFIEKSIEANLRVINMQNAWENFLEHPFTGVGYSNAAIKNGSGTRSNNQYLQILASSGIIFFIIYIYYNFRLVVFRFNLLKRPEVALSLIYHASFLLFKRPLNIVAISGYIAIYFYFESTRKKSYNSTEEHKKNASITDIPTF